MKRTLIDKLADLETKEDLDAFMWGFKFNKRDLTKEEEAAIADKRQELLRKQRDGS